MFGLRGRYRIVTCSGVVVQDEGNVTSTGLRIASASAAVLVSAAVVGAALFGGSAISDSGAPSGQDERLVAVPASPSPSARGRRHRVTQAPDPFGPGRTLGLSVRGTPRSRPSVIAIRPVARQQRRLLDRARAQAPHRRPPRDRQQPVPRSAAPGRHRPRGRPRRQSRHSSEDDYPALIGLYHALGLGERGAGGTE